MSVVKIRTAKSYRHPVLDFEIRKRRTMHESVIMSEAKLAGVRTPMVYFADPVKCEIIMEWLEGVQVKKSLTKSTSRQIGVIAARLHSKGIIHGDLTTSNFIVSKSGISTFDFGLSFHSERIEDMATDVRLFKEVLSSAHTQLDGAFEEFVSGYENEVRGARTNQVLEKVKEIEMRGRYARVE